VRRDDRARADAGHAGPSRPQGADLGPAARLRRGALDRQQCAVDIILDSLFKRAMQLAFPNECGIKPLTQSRHLVQHYYIFGSRSIYYNGWKAEAAHHPDNVDFIFKPGEKISDKSLDDDVWELYNLNEDFNERIDLAKKYPEKLTELKKIFDEQAEKNHLYPLIDWYDVYNKRIHHPNGADKQAPIK